jgi:drug/metabolite transporter (DMT)-like permease
MGRIYGYASLAHEGADAVQSLMGESACLTAAFLWAVAVVLFRVPIAAWGARTANLVKCLLGTGLLLMMVGVALAPATVAAVLLATSSIFSLVIEAIADRKRPTALAVVGTIVAVVGVAFLVGFASF